MSAWNSFFKFYFYKFIYLFVLHPGVSFSSFLSSQSLPSHSPLFPPPNCLPLLHFCSGKDRSPMSFNKTWHIKLTVRQSTSPCIKAGQKDTIWEVGLRGSLCSHCWESHKRTKLHNYNVYADCLGQSHIDSLVVASFSVNVYEPRLADHVCFLVVFLTSLAPEILSPPLLQDSLSSSKYLTVSLHRFPFVTGWSLSDDNCVRHPSRNIAEC